MKSDLPSAEVQSSDQPPAQPLPDAALSVSVKESKGTALSVQCIVPRVVVTKVNEVKFTFILSFASFRDYGATGKRSHSSSGNFKH